MAVTSHDVARAAGVSQPTVSRALRDDPTIAEATRKRIAEIAASLGYIPSEVGRSLSKRATRRIAVIADLDNPLWPMLVDGLHDELIRHNYSMTLLAERGDPLQFEHQLLSGWADGVIITSARLTAVLPKKLARRGTPFILVNRTIEGLEADAVVADNVAGSRMAADLLVEAGHTRIGALLGPPDTSTGRDREVGLREQLAAHGMRLTPSRVLHGPFAYSHGREGLPEILKGRYPPTAVFCANDIIAIGALNTAHALGLKVPDDLALIGFDDLDEASWPVYDLTTIHVPFAEMVRAAVARLLDRLRDPQLPPKVEVHPVSAVVRATHLSA